MKYGDFSSLVQLGVGLHLGTAVLQLYREFGLQPLIRTLERIKALTGELKKNKEEIIAKSDQLHADFEIFKIEFFKEFRKYVLINLAFAVALLICLIVISIAAESELHPGAAVILVAISILPASISLGVLWFDTSRRLTPLKERADKLEQEAIRASAGGVG
jgi:hypothetical protein